MKIKKEMERLKLPYITINTNLRKNIGWFPSILLTHFIDLEENIFKGEFYQQESRLAEEMCVSVSTIKRTIKELSLLNLISVESKKKDGLRKNYYTLNKELIMIYCKGMVQNEPYPTVQNEPYSPNSMVQNEPYPTVQNEPTNTITNLETINNIKNINKDNNITNSKVTTYSDLFNNGLTSTDDILNYINS